MARPASYMSENVDFRPRWVRMKPLGKNIDPNISTRVLGDSSFLELSKQVTRPDPARPTTG